MKQKSRLVFVDIHRGLALLVMFEVHVFNSLLQQNIKTESWFFILNFINGLVAPSFLFISGFSFVLASRSKLEQFRNYGYEFWRQLGRIFFVFVVGYVLHIPFFSISKMFSKVTPDLAKSFFAVDVLQCIAVGLLLIFLLRLFIKSDLWYRNILFFAGSVFVLLSPLTWNYDFNSSLPLVVSSYFNKMNGSLFPIFPWLGFMIFGSVVSIYYLNSKALNKEKEFFKNVFYFAAAAIIIGHIVLRNPFGIKDFFPEPNYFFFILRLGYVLLLLAGCWIFSQKVEMTKSFVLDISRESLLVYFLHLGILYRKFWDEKSLTDLVNNRLDVFQAAIGTLALIVLMIAAARFWSWTKKNHKKYSQIIFWAIIIISSGVFLLI